jgi:hypothetical protein
MDYTLSFNQEVDSYRYQLKFLDGNLYSNQIIPGLHKANSATSPSHAVNANRYHHQGVLSNCSDSMPAGTQHIRCEWQTSETLVQTTVLGVGQFSSALAERNIQFNGNYRANDLRLTALLFGPTMLVPMAYESIFCLHASSIRIDQHAVIVLGDSGVGKSTLASHFGNTDRAITDDITPLCFDDPQFNVLGCFPQLKHLADYPPKIPSRQPVAFIVEIHAGGSDPPQASRLNPTEAMRCLIRHTVSARQFSPSILKQHLEFCAALSSSIKVYRLHYKKDLEKINRLATFVENLE